MEIKRTAAFDHWMLSLKDRAGRTRIIARIRRLGDGNPGDFRSVGSGVLELRVNFGPGYRVYYLQRGDILILLLCGGDKSTQSRDIERAKAMASEYHEEG